MADGKTIAAIDTFDRETQFFLGLLPAGTHSVELANMEASCKSFHGMAVPVRLGDNHCSVEFNVASDRTYTLVVNVIDDNAVCIIR